MLVTVLACAAPARGAPADPLPGFPFYASTEIDGTKPAPAPGGGFEGPCGLAVDSLGGLYVADYYNNSVAAFSSSRAFLGQLFEVDPLDGPCGLAVGADGALYVNVFHRSIVKYVPQKFPLTFFTGYGPGVVFDSSSHPTGVAIHPSSGNVYVNTRTHVAVYDPSGNVVMEGGEPLRIGMGSLDEAYGLAISGYAPTAGRVYVPDAATDTVKAYDPAVDVDDPVQVIDGDETPEGRFVSLRDSAVAVDRVSGFVYVADDLQPQFNERPEAAIYAFDPSGAYAGRLKYNVVNARPLGLAVDNSTAPTQGRVYVTDGNTERAAVCAYNRAPASLTPGAFKAPCSQASSSALLSEAQSQSPPPAAFGSLPASPAAATAPGAARDDARPRKRRIRPRSNRRRQRAMRHKHLRDGRRGGRKAARNRSRKGRPK